MTGRGVGAVFAGIFAIFVITSILNSTLAAIDPNWNSIEEDPAFEILFALIAYGCIASFVGGYVTASIASKRGWQHAMVVAAFLLFMSLMATTFGTHRNPLWYSVLSAALPVAFTAFGAHSQSRYPLFEWKH